MTTGAKQTSSDAAHASAPNPLHTSTPNPLHTLMDLATSHWKSAALSAGVELGLFALLAGRGPMDSTGIREALQTSPLHTSALLDALVALNLLTRDGATYGLHPDARPFLDPASERSLLTALKFNAMSFPLWSKLGMCVKQGAPMLPPKSHLGPDAGFTRQFVLAMHERAVAFGPMLMGAIDVTDANRLLDVGAGPGTFSRLLAERKADLRVTLFELPAVLEVSRELLAGHAVSSRVAFVAGDYHTDALPQGFDAVLYAGALHQETPPRAAALLEKLKMSLRPGGRLFVLDLMLDPGRAAPASSALFGLSMLLTNADAHMYAIDEVSSLVRDAGLEWVSEVRVGQSPYGLVVGRRRT